MKNVVYVVLGFIAGMFVTLMFIGDKCASRYVATEITDTRPATDFEKCFRAAWLRGTVPHCKESQTSHQNIPAGSSASRAMGTMIDPM